MYVLLQVCNALLKSAQNPFDIKSSYPFDVKSIYLALLFKKHIFGAPFKKHIFGAPF